MSAYREQTAAGALDETGVDSSTKVVELSTVRKKRERHPTTPIALRCTDVANAERFASRWMGQARYAPLRKKWFVWDGTRWCEDGIV